ncbi:hypothetical protein BKK50_11345 [Rodentibacter rarus]|uniref:Uncharacterized protein n=1 Tax=Rodentibacter rarus TaxID=1908260 RepID=A0A1V3IDZ0_9PAST|nr:hypothetical protein [Rodentibacter rarus]OOF38734.1 hypothetical protein BKK50_11345 [Rodentibacter rarus]
MAEETGEYKVQVYLMRAQARQNISTPLLVGNYYGATLSDISFLLANFRYYVANAQKQKF